MFYSANNIFFLAALYKEGREREKNGSPETTWQTLAYSQFIS